MTVFRQILEMAIVAYDATHSLTLLDDRLERGEIHWRYIVESGVTFRFAALDIPTIRTDHGQELAAIVGASTRKYKRGRTAPGAGRLPRAGRYPWGG